mmetsp:Transcript_25431/g.61260  ORF Transcript_25431/g.61260 Transcript_25431/m.61260 type:complete len:387 (+) Transcript_25431:299-1459(+)|eukprot:CAMPEP_0114513930 /NCGR_PEP_ID=MMETSP0109-20121206/15864_1 /TAXON_ID=29199 /ORGANISM="Chlorarachnion reptans, Strain CCCM449" /LENGTH=386 /DNA_ID=CAMNT_0001693899 /DNA_START=286 /DNA_END=1446 /DNA_ORIENTATION=+
MAALRQRKKEDKKAEKNKEENVEGETKADSKKPDWQTNAGWIIMLIPCVLLPALACGFAYNTYGINFFVPESLQFLSHTPEFWQQEILPSKTVLFLGGPHRGGTTVLWRCVREHPDIAGFGDSFTTGIDLSEGIFMQDVYPNFGIGMEFNQYDWRKRRGGLGQYALLPEHRVRLNESSRLVTEANQARLLNRFGYFWNLSKPILLEKSPPNAVISRFLQALVNLNVPGGLERYGPSTESIENSGESRAKFLFITRDPIANALSHKAWKDCKRMPLRLLVANWVAVNTYMRENMPYLQYARVLRLEDFQKDPDSHLKDIFEWLGLDPLLYKNRPPVKRDTNKKYRKKYCALMESPEQRKEHFEIKKQFDETIKSLGYDLSEWDCGAK